MAVEDKYVDADIEAGKKAPAVHSGGAEMVSIVKTFEIAAADDNGSVYRFATVNDSLIPYELQVHCDAITNGTDYDIGIYLPDSGAVVDKDLLTDGQSFASATEFNGLQTVDIANRDKSLYELAGKTEANRVGAYDLAITANTVGTAAGTVTVRGLFVQK